MKKISRIVFVCVKKIGKFKQKRKIKMRPRLDKANQMSKKQEDKTERNRRTKSS